MAKMAELSQILAELRAGSAFLVTSHSSPDGDAIGSMLAMYHFLRALGKAPVVCANEGPVPRIYQWLPAAECILGPDAPLPSCDTAVVVDVAQRDRLGRIAERIGPRSKLVVIDHHVEENPCGDANFVDAGYAAVGEILVELFINAGIPMSPEAATCAYVAQATDTGGFRFANTNARSHRLAAHLLETGIDVSDINRRVFDEMSHAKVKLLGRLLERRRFAHEGRVAYSELTQQDMADAQAREEDSDNLINFLRNINGVEVALLFREVDSGKTKVSCRSRNKFNAALFLQRFGGGGHRAAAGATVAMSLPQACSVVLACLPGALEDAQ